MNQPDKSEKLNPPQDERQYANTRAKKVIEHILVPKTVLENIRKQAIQTPKGLIPQKSGGGKAAEHDRFDLLCYPAIRICRNQKQPITVKEIPYATQTAELVETKGKNDFQNRRHLHKIPLQ